MQKKILSFITDFIPSLRRFSVHHNRKDNAMISCMVLVHFDVKSSSQFMWMRRQSSTVDRPTTEEGGGVLRHPHPPNEV